MSDNKDNSIRPAMSLPAHWRAIMLDYFQQRQTTSSLWGNRVWAYSVALISTAFSLLVRMALHPWVKDDGPFLFFAPAVMFSAWFGGFGPGLLATAAGAMIADYYLLEPRGMFSIASSDIAKFTVFAVVGVQISWLSGALRSAKNRAEADAHAARRGEKLLEKARAALQVAHDELEQRVRERTAELGLQKSLLEAQSDASLDGILVVSQQSKVILSNRRLAELWGIGPEAFNQTLSVAIAKMREKLADPRQPLCENPQNGQRVDSESPSNLILTDGRVFESYSSPVRGHDGTEYGQVWFFRDITERRRVAKQILEAGERERQRIGQDLHDDLCQHLAGITCLGRVLQQRLSAKFPSESQGAGQIVELTEQAIRRARDLARGLQPVELQRDELGTALRELGSTAESLFPVRCHFRGETAVPLADAVAPIHLYRIAQEAINNAVRHGKAQNIYLDLFNVQGRVILTIEDDGVGIPTPPPANGLGLRTMQTRARMIGAVLNVERANGSGTLVTCQLPVYEAGNRHERASV